MPCCCHLVSLDILKITRTSVWLFAKEKSMYIYSRSWWCYPRSCHHFLPRNPHRRHTCDDAFCTMDLLEEVPWMIEPIVQRKLQGALHTIQRQQQKVGLLSFPRPLLHWCREDSSTWMKLLKLLQMLLAGYYCWSSNWDFHLQCWIKRNDVIRMVQDETVSFPRDSAYSRS